MQIESINRDPGVAVSGRRSAIAEMKEILSLRLPYFYRCALRLLGNAADAEDAVQEALLAAYRHIGQFRGQSQMTTWLTTIVRRCALMHYANGGARPICRWMIRSRDATALWMGKTRRQSAQPRRRVSKFRAGRTFAQIHSTAVPHVAKNI
jgi:RNA polymerase sigma factor (sigma-70 family)